MKELSRRDQRKFDEWLIVCKRIREGIAPLPNESEDAKRKRINFLLDPKNFFEFCQYYFPDYASAPFGWFHKEAINDILVKEERNNIWEWSRELAKSVLADVLLPAHMLFTGRLDGLILCSETESKGKKLISDLEAQLRENRRIIHDFGDFGITGSWINGYFQTKDGIGVWAFGLGQNPAGVRNGHRRPNLGIVDDADSRKKAKNQTLTKEAVDWIRGEFMGCLATKGRTFIYANNRVAKNGITAHMVGDLEEGDPKNEGFKHIKVYWTEEPKTHAKKMPDEGGVPAWKERYTLQECIDKINDMGYRNSMRQLYHLHIEDGNIFTDENMPWIDCLPIQQYDALVSYCDPAFGESGKGCYRAIVLIGLRNRDFDIVWIWIKQNGNFASAHHHLAEMIREGSPVLFANNEKIGFRQQVNCEHWVESNELQKILLKKIYQEENLTRAIPWYPKFDMDKKADKIGRIESLETLAEHGHLRFNAALKKDKDMQTLRDQFKGFPDGFVDGPDAVQGGISKLSRKFKTTKAGYKSGNFAKNNKRIG